MIHRSPEEKREIIHIVEHSILSVTETLKELDVPRSSFYRWYGAYLEEGEEGLIEKRPRPRQFWNRIPDTVCKQVVDCTSSKKVGQKWKFAKRHFYEIIHSPAPANYAGVFAVKYVS